MNCGSSLFVAVFWFAVIGLSHDIDLIGRSYVHAFVLLFFFNRNGRSGGNKTVAADRFFCQSYESDVKKKYAQALFIVIPTFLCKTFDTF